MSDAAGRANGRYKIVTTLWQTSDGKCCVVLQSDTKQTLVLESFDKARWEERQADVWLKRLTVAPGLMPKVLERREDDHTVRIVSALPPGRDLCSDSQTWAADTSGRRAQGLARAIGRLHVAGFIHGALQPDAVYASGSAVGLVGPGTVAFHSAGGGCGAELAAALGEWAAPELALDSPDSASDYYALGQMLQVCCPNLPKRLAEPLAELLNEDPNRRAAVGLRFTAPPRTAERVALAACAALLLAGALTWLLLQRAPPPEAAEKATTTAVPQQVAETGPAKEYPAKANRESQQPVQPPEGTRKEEPPDERPAQAGPLSPLSTAAERKEDAVPAAVGPPRTVITIPTEKPRRTQEADDADTEARAAQAASPTGKSAAESGRPSASAPKAAAALPALKPLGRKPPLVEMVFVVDTTGSMGGLIKGATEKIWFVINEIATARPAPEIRIGFVLYRDLKDDYVTRLYPLEEDFNYVSENMAEFRAGGGGDEAEHVSMALQDAVSKMRWSKEGTGYRVIFLVGDSPPHTDYKDGLSYKTACAQAVSQRTIVNAIRCGENPRTEKYWREIANLGYGQFLTIPQNGGATTIETPVDAQIGKLVDELEATTLPFQGREADQERNAKVTAALSSSAKADKGCLYTKTSQQLIRWDLVTACLEGRLRVEEVSEDQLPETLRAMPQKADRMRWVAERVAKRRTCLAQIAQLEPVRRQFIEGELAKKGAVKGKDAEPFDSAVVRVIRMQGSWAGLKW